MLGSIFTIIILGANNQQFWLLGDSGYPLQPWLITPVENPGNLNEIKFNEQHVYVRGIIERTIGIWKQRFRCVLGERKLHYQPTMCRKIILATAILHNYLIENNYVDDDPIVLRNQRQIHEDVLENRTWREPGLAVRRSIIENYFTQNA